MSILIKNVSTLAMGIENDVVQSENILIQGSRIVYRGPDIPDSIFNGHPDSVIDGTGLLAMPGLINCHNHAAMSLLRGYSDDLRLMDWLSQKIWPAEARMTPDDIYWGTLLAICEMIRSGTTAFADMYASMKRVAQAVSESGMRVAMARGMVDTDEHATKRFQQAISLFENYHGQAEGRITVMLGPHAPFTCSPGYLTEILNEAMRLGAPVHIHLAETEEEVRIIQERYGKRPAAHLADLGFWSGPHVLAAHAVHLNEEDIRLMAGMRGGIAHNPVSNFKLGCGIAPVKELQANKIPVGLGTDGPGSASTLDLFSEMKACAWLQKVAHRDPSVFTGYEILEMATVEGAKVLGLKEVGILEVNMIADLILIDMEQPHLYPRHHIPSLLAYSATGHDVHTVIINGKIVMQNRQLLTVDEEKIRFEAETRAKRIVRGL